MHATPPNQRQSCDQKLLAHTEARVQAAAAAGMPATATVMTVSTSGDHTFRKPLVDTLTLVQGIGVAGDAHAGATMMMPSKKKGIGREPVENKRQVHVFASERLAELNELGFPVSPGDLGENLTTEGVQVLDLPLGTVLAIGESARVEVTGLRNPCRTLEAKYPGITKEFLVKCGEDPGAWERRTGIFGVCVAGGAVRPGDVMTIELPPEPHEPLPVSYTHLTLPTKA